MNKIILSFYVSVSLLGSLQVQAAILPKKDIHSIVIHSINKSELVEKHGFKKITNDELDLGWSNPSKIPVFGWGVEFVSDLWRIKFELTHKDSTEKVAYDCNLVVRILTNVSYDKKLQVIHSPSLSIMPMQCEFSVTDGLKKGDYPEAPFESISSTDRINLN